MLPSVLKLFFERIKVLPNAELVTLIKRERGLTIPTCIDLLIDFAYDPNKVADENTNEANRILLAMIESQSNIIVLKHLFELQGPFRDEKIKTIKGNKFIKSLPPWKQERYDCLIRKIMLRPNGLFNVIVTLIELMGNNRTTETAFQIAKCICQPPKNNENKEQYYQQIANQIIELIKMSQIRIIFDQPLNNDSELHREYLRFGQSVGLECVHLFSVVDRKFAFNFLLEPLFRDFFRILQSDDSEFDEPEIVLDSEKFMDILHLQNSLLNTHKCMFFIVRWLRAFYPIHLDIMYVMETPDNKYRTVAKEILVKLIEFSHMFLRDSDQFVRKISNLEFCEEARKLNKKLKIRKTMQKKMLEVAVNINYIEPDPEDCEDYLVYDEVVEVIMTLSTNVKNEVVSSLCIWLMEKRLIKDTIPPGSNLLMASELKKLEHDRMFRNQLLFSFVTKMESNCFTKPADIIKFAQIAINQYSQVRVKYSEKDIRDNHVLENLNFALRMLECMLKYEFSKSDVEIFQQLFPVLTNLIALYPEDTTADVITNICTAIVTKGHVNLITEKSSALIEEVEESIDPELQDAFDAIDDPEISYKGFGLAKLHDLLEQKNESAMKHRIKIYNIFSNYLFHSDYFLYLRAIRGLALLGDRFTEKLLPVIIRKISTTRQVSIENWMTLNEVFMQIIKNLGEMAACYRNLILNCLLPFLSDKEELVRASTVSNLGELCCQLEYAFSPVMHEILIKVCNLLEHDPSSRVKVACSILIRKLLLGRMENLSRLRPEIIQLASIMKPIRESLERVYKTESNEIVLDHVAVANKALSESITSVPFFSDQSLNRRDISIGDSDIRLSYRKLTF